MRDNQTLKELLGWGKRMKTLLLATDAWTPQVNGVVRTLQSTIRVLEKDYDIQTQVISPDLFRNIPCPMYPEIRLALAHRGSILKHFGEPDFVHIATEGPIGNAVRKHCEKKDIPFTTSFHTHFPQYLYKMARIPQSWTYRLLKHFHRHSEGVLVPTEGIAQELENASFENHIAIWSRGVDTNIFYPHDPAIESDKPILLYCGRVSIEKNIEAFLELDIDARKVVVGDGPIRERLEKRYPDAEFVGYKRGHELAAYYSAADAFVFPSKSDTFGLVMIEAMACGTPVAAYPVTGPNEVVTDSGVGKLNKDLKTAVLLTLAECSRQRCYEFVRENFTWKNSTERFYKTLVEIL